MKVCNKSSQNPNNKSKGFGMGNYTKIPMRIDATKVPNNAKMKITPKWEKNGF
jgi:hypothetical protein